MVYRPVYKSVHSPIGKSIGVAVGSGSSLDILASVGTSTSPISTGTKAVTGIGFQPKLVMLSGILQTADGSASSLFYGFGAATSTSSRASVAIASQTSLTTTSTRRRHTNDKAISILTTDGLVSEEADLSSMDSDGFTLNWTTATTSARIVNHICLAGSSLEVQLSQHQMNNTNAPQAFPHGLSGTPTTLIFFTSHTSTTPTSTGDPLFLSFGAWSGGNQFGASAYSANAVTTSSTRRLLANDRVASLMFSSVTRSIAVSSVDATNVNVTYPITSSTSQGYIWMIALRGIKSQIGTFDCNGSLDPLTISTPGITPKIFLPVLVPSGVDNINVPQNDLNLTFAASDGSALTSCQILDQNGLTTTNARRVQNTTLLTERNYAASTVHSSTVAFSGSSIVIDPSTLSDSSYAQGAYLVLGS